MPAGLEWERDGAAWPNREASRFVPAGGLRWHVQTRGQGPAVLLLHGTGASSHSWRDLLPLLGERFTVIAPDLPGHGFTSKAVGDGMSLPGMGRLVAQLLKVLGVEPEFVVGHSAGAAIAARMSLDGRLAPRALVSLNGAFLPFAGALRVFSPVAKFLASTSLAARLAAVRARDPRAVGRLLASTGSTLDARGTALYAQLVQSAGHVAGALAMMASWDLDGLPRELRRLSALVLLLVGENDLTVSPQQASRVAALLPHAEVERLPGLGHLAHEEQPQLVAERICAFLGRASAAA
ncbi:MAG: alpha/beta fold hydrolase [Burkholderiales bacterium]|nr:alpha/beta fold hydrolase [Burkholderiales bacterium]